MACLTLPVRSGLSRYDACLIHFTTFFYERKSEEDCRKTIDSSAHVWYNSCGKQLEFVQYPQWHKLKCEEIRYVSKERIKP